MPKRTSTPIVIVVNPDGTVSAKFTGDVEAAHFYAPSQAARPRIEIDAAGLRAILGDGTTGARIAAGTPRPLFQFGLAPDINPLATGIINNGGPGGAFQIDPTFGGGGENVFDIGPITVPAGISLLGLAGVRMVCNTTAGDYVAVQVELRSVDDGSYLGRLGPAAIATLVPPSMGASAGEVPMAPFQLDNSAGVNALTRRIALRACSTSGNALVTGTTGFILGIYG